MTMEKITPEMAEQYLGRNTKNRHIRAASVAQYARDMASGDWLYTGEAVKFDKDGNLIDGQHRLKAIVEAGVPIEMEVVRGLEPEAQDVLDTGMKRTPGDMLSINGYGYANMLAAAARIGLRVETGNIYGNKFRPTHAEVLDYVADNPRLVHSCEIGKYGTKADCRPAMVAYTHYVLSQINKDMADEFWVGVAEKVDLHRGDPRLALSNRFAEQRRQNQRVGDATYLSMIYRTWNAWRQGKQMSLVRVHQNGTHVEIPVPR